MSPSPSHQWLSLLWSDSQFPAGGASHSGGLEGAVQSGYLRGTEDLRAWVEDYLRDVFGPSDLAACVLAHRVASSDDRAKLFAIDERLNALKIAREERQASAMMGQRRLKVLRDAFDDNRLNELWDAVQINEWNAHAACVWGVAGIVGGIGEADAARSLAYGALIGIASAGIRLRLYGQQATQRLLLDVAPTVEHAIERAQRVRGTEELASHGPRLELAQMHHERARVRLFMS